MSISHRPLSSVDSIFWQSVQQVAKTCCKEGGVGALRGTPRPSFFLAAGDTFSGTANEPLTTGVPGFPPMISSRLTFKEKLQPIDQQTDTEGQVSKMTDEWGIKWETLLSHELHVHSWK